MLILSRKSGQKLIINDDIVITIIETGPTITKIGIEAPKSVKIYREEVYLEIKSENINSNTADANDLAMLEQFMKMPQSESTSKIIINNNNEPK